MKKLIPQKIKNFYHLVQAMLAAFFHGFPARKIKIVGVTGTNGKTTTVQLIAGILREAGWRVALASTINFQIAEKSWKNKTKFTTLSSWKLEKFLSQAVRAGCEWAVLEVSSHALDQNRVWGVDFETAVITNVTREHLDYHGNMENYRIAKLKLFQRSKKAIVNLDMENFRDYLDCGKKVKYGFTTRENFDSSQCDCGDKYDCGGLEVIRAEEVILSADGSNFLVREEKIFLKLPGLFNVENALAAIAVGLAENLKLGLIRKALEKITIIPGRMERVPNSKNIDIIVDYAVTPDSLKKMFALLNKIKKESARIIFVAGACGERDRGKRPIMGEIISRNADFVFITNEDPYGEDPQEIIDQVFSGVLKKGNAAFEQKSKVEGENCWRILDRREAIKKALEMAKPEDLVVITGKGAEENMAVGKKRIPWNDGEVIREVLQEIG